jgi:hypothetical protein
MSSVGLNGVPTAKAAITSRNDVGMLMLARRHVPDSLTVLSMPTIAIKRDLYDVGMFEAGTATS